ncbi:MAG: hypothetical protein M5U34_31095 [Chloroflexi bacterium]|nr:hypothetical protein [Chloroflexota bacterium]
MRLLYRVINRQPSRINAQLILAANTLRLDSLEKAITAICQSIDASDPNAELELVTHIKAGAGALGGIENSLSLLTSEHNAWQAIDDELRRVEATLDNGIEELEDAWYDLEPMTHNLIKGCDDEWAVDINDVILFPGQRHRRRHYYSSASPLPPPSQPNRASFSAGRPGTINPLPQPAKSRRIIRFIIRDYKMSKADTPKSEPAPEPFLSLTSIRDTHRELL